MKQVNQNPTPELSPGINEIRANFADDFIQEILEALDSIELELVNLEVEPGNSEYLDSVYRYLHTIRGLADLLEESLAAQITKETGELLEVCRKYNISANRIIINALLQSVMFLRKICEGKETCRNSKFQGEVEQHLHAVGQLREEIILDIKQPIRPPEDRIGEILLEKGAIGEKDIEDVLAKQDSIYPKLKFGEIAMRERKVDAGELIKAIRAQKIRNESNDQYVRIPIKRLDQILEIASRLEGIQKDLYHESVLRFGSNDVFSVETKQAEVMSSDIRKIMQELRRVALKQSFQKLTRAVRSMIEEAGLNVVFSTTGESIELNKELAEDIIMPLAEIVELMLSAFSPDDGKEKESMGNIEVAASKSGETVTVEITSNRKSPDCSEFAVKKLEQARKKVEKLKGKIDYQDTDNGCRAAIILDDSTIINNTYEM